MCVSAVSQNSVVDQRRIVEALHVELDLVLRRQREEEEDTEKNDVELKRKPSLLICVV